VDRGGLTHITEMFYPCLIAIEKVYKSYISSEDISQLSDIKTTITVKMLGDGDVRFYWDIAVGLTAVEVGNELLQMVIES